MNFYTYIFLTKNKNNFNINKIKEEFNIQEKNIESCLVISKNNEIQFINVFEYSTVGEFSFIVYKKLLFELIPIHKQIIINSLGLKNANQLKHMLKKVALKLTIDNKDFKFIQQDIALLSNVFDEMKPHFYLLKENNIRMFLIEKQVIFIENEKYFERHVLKDYNELVVLLNDVYKSTTTTTYREFINKIIYNQLDLNELYICK